MIDKRVLNLIAGIILMVLFSVLFNTIGGDKDDKAQKNLDKQITKQEMELKRLKHQIHSIR